MKEFKEARENYESIPIPEELDQRVRAGIRQGRKTAAAAMCGGPWAPRPPASRWCSAR